MTRFTPFDAADYLDSDEAIAAYLTAALEDAASSLPRNCVKRRATPT